MMPKGHLDVARAVDCRICNTQFVATHSQHCYCGTACQKEGWRKHSAKHRDRNREKIRADNRAKYAANPEATKLRVLAYRATPQGAAVARKTWENANRNAAKARARYVRYRDSHPGLIAKRVAIYAARNPEVKRAGDNRRRARLIGSEGSHTAADTVRILKAQHYRCAYCRLLIRRAKLRELDHIRPISRGGSNAASNLQWLCRPCNQAKWAKQPEDFARELGFLL